MDHKRKSLTTQCAKSGLGCTSPGGTGASPFADVWWLLAPVLSALLLVAAPAGHLNAQAATGARPLAVPVGTELRCRPVPIDSSSDVEKATRTFEFQTGKDDETERSLALTFDRVGRPLLFQERTLLLRPDGLIEAHTIVAGFPESAGIEGFHAIVKPAAPAGNTAGRSAPMSAKGAVLPPERAPLTDGEKAQIRMLMAWLWDHRCGPKTK